MKKVFFYGTLKKGHKYHYLVWKDAKFIKTDTIKADMYVGKYRAYPVVIRGNGIVVGEIWEVSEANFEDIKRMEENAGYYVDKVSTDSGEEVNIFMVTNDIKNDLYSEYQEKIEVF